MEKNVIFAHLKDNNNNNTIAVLIISVKGRVRQQLYLQAWNQITQKLKNFTFQRGRRFFVLWPMRLQ